MQTENLGGIINEMRAMKRYAQSENAECRYVAYWTYQTFADRLEEVMREMDTAARLINCYLNEIPLNPWGHNWLIRNGYKDKSYQSSAWGQEEVEVGDDS